MAKLESASDLSVEEMAENAQSASGFLKSLSNETRLMILCHLAPGPMTVSELEQKLGVRQANVSQHLARLKADRLVQSQRSGKTIAYSIADADALAVLRVLYSKYCGA